MSQNLSSLQFKHIDAENNTSGYHRVVAKQGSKQVGKIDWDGNETGRVNSVHVDEEHRRQGIGTALWNEAHSISSQKGLVAPKHDKDSNLSVEGKAWAKKTK
jgi:ribosomal protein S18 acetylase RimI-like enzyme